MGAASSDLDVSVGLAMGDGGLLGPSVLVVGGE